MTTKQVYQRYGIVRQPLYNWMSREQHSFTTPRLRGTAGNNRWAIEDIKAYEEAIAA